MRRALPALLCIAAFPSLAAADATPASALVERIQKSYDGLKSLHASFDQELSDGLGGKPKKATGVLWLKKPGRMRWEYQKPEPKLMVADGQALWVYEPEDEQAFRTKLSTFQLPSAVTFLFGEGKLADEFEIARASDDEGKGLAGAGESVLKLVPRKASTHYRYLLFVVDEKTAMVTGTVIFDQSGHRNRMSFRDVTRDAPAPDDKFKFTPPVGTRILRQ